MLLLGVLIFVTLPWGIAFTWLEADQVRSYVHAVHVHGQHSNAAIGQV